MANFKKIITLAILLGCQRAQSTGTAQNLPKAKYNMCGKIFDLEVADTDEARTIGLMHRSALNKDSGMIFIFPTSEPRQFWMRNVSFDIDIGFFDSKGVLLNYATMLGTSPLVRDELLPRYPSKGEAQYAVEVEAGFFSKHLKKEKCKLLPLAATKK